MDKVMELELESGVAEGGDAGWEVRQWGWKGESREKKNKTVRSKCIQVLKWELKFRLLNNL